MGTMEKMKTFNEEQLATLAKACQNLGFGASLVKKLAQDQKLTDEMAHTHASYLENNFIDLAEVLDFASHLAKEQEKRYADIKAANDTIRELRTQLGSSKPVEGLKEQLKVLSDAVRTWWNVEGFHHVHEMTFHPYGGLEVEFCFMLDHYRVRATSEHTTPRTRAEHIAHLQQMGFEFADFEKGRSEQLSLVDTSHNRTLLLNLLRTRFPSIVVTSWGNRNSHSYDDRFVIDRIQATIYELTDI